MHMVASGTQVTVPLIVFAWTIFTVGSLLSLAKKDVTWIDFVVMVGLGILIGSTYDDLFRGLGILG